MPNISVRKLKEETIHALRLQASRHGVSMEEEARQIIVKGVSVPNAIGDLAISLFNPVFSDEAAEEVDFVLPEREINDPPFFE